MVFTIYEHGGHIDYVIWLVLTNFCYTPAFMPRDILISSISSSVRYVRNFPSRS